MENSTKNLNLGKSLPAPWNILSFMFTPSFDVNMKITKFVYYIQFCLWMGGFVSLTCL